MVFWFAERVITSIIVNPGDFAVVGWVGSGFGEPSWCCCCFSAKTCCNGAYRFLSCLLWFCVLGSAPGFPVPVIITFLSVFPCHWAAGTPHQAAGRGRLTCFLLDCLSCSVQSVSPLWEGRRVPLLLLGKRPLQDAPVGELVGGREFWLHRKCRGKKKKATDRRENLSSDSCFLQQRKLSLCKCCGSWQEAEMKFRGAVRFIQLFWCFCSFQMCI